MPDPKTAPRVFDEREFARQLRPAWTPLNIALMVFLFVVGLWPLGIAAIVYMAYGREMGIDLSNWGRAKRSGAKAMDGLRRGASPKTGNVAFDEWREEEMRRLDEERRKLDEAKAEFEEHVADLRRARDREEFEDFLRRRDNTIDADAKDSGASS